MKHFHIQAIMHLATAQAGAEKMSNDLKSQAYNKLDRSKQLPRKAKKLLRKDALLDMTLADFSYLISKYFCLISSL